MSNSNYIDPNTVRPVAETVVDEPSFWSRWWWLPLLALLGLGLLLWRGCRDEGTAAVTHTVFHTEQVTETHTVTPEAVPTVEETIVDEEEDVAIVEEHVTYDHINIPSADEAALRTDLTGLHADIDAGGDYLLDGARNVCAAFLNGVTDIHADIDNWFHLGAGTIDAATSTAVLNHVGSASWCHR